MAWVRTPPPSRIRFEHIFGSAWLGLANVLLAGPVVAHFLHAQAGPRPIRASVSMASAAAMTTL
eukprot:1778227-Rhodomonas_salina.1